MMGEEQSDSMNTEENTYKNNEEGLREAVIELVNAKNYQPGKPSALAKRLKLSADDSTSFRRLIKQMVREGLLSFGEKHLVFPIMKTTPETTKRVKQGNHISGIFRRTRSGFGFVRPDGTARDLGRDADVFIAERNSSDAASGDRVRVRLMGKGRQGKLEGRILDIIERDNNQFVGTYFEEAGLALVTVDGGAFNHPIHVGDPGAKGAQPDDKVVLEIVRFPSGNRTGEGVLVDILGKRGDPGVDTLSIIHEYGLPGEFPEDVVEDSRKQAAAFDETIGPNRKDITKETVITIDPVDARDFDDAISLKQIENGHWSLGVHIADVSHFVQPNTPLDREARDRATSVYLPDQVIPMLPEIISNNLASLQPDQVRYAMTARIEFTDKGVRVATEVFKSAIRSDRRFTYEEVDTFLEAPEKQKENLAPAVHALLGDMHTLAMILRKRRFKRGSLELSLPETKIDLDKDGNVTGAHTVENTESHQVIEEFMLAANEAVAEHLLDNGLLFLRRGHAAPNPKKLEALTAFVHDLGFKTDSLESRFALQKLLSDVHGDPRERAVHYATLRAMQRAEYTPEEEGHFALASECYCHFTSPIRRYPDLTIHRLLESLALGKPKSQSLEQLFVEGDHCSDREQRATAAERELVKIKLLSFLSDKVGESFEGVVTGVESYGLYVAGTELPAEGLVHLSSLSDDHYRFERKSHTLTGYRSGNMFRLGDMVRVEVAAVDIERRQLDFRLLGHVARNLQQSDESKSHKYPSKTKKNNSKYKSKSKPKHQHSKKPKKKRGKRK